MTPRLTVLQGPHEGLAVELRRGANRLGRDPANDLPINDPTVSGQHCEIIVGDTTIRIRDLDSCNGTFLDGQPVSEAEIQPGQSLRVGTVELHLEFPGGRIAVPAMAPPEVLQAVTLPDGSPACLHHPEVAATRQCTRCRYAFCERCVHRLRLMKGKFHFFCPECSGECTRLGEPEAQGESIARRVWKNLRFIFARRRRR